MPRGRDEPSAIGDGVRTVRQAVCGALEVLLDGHLLLDRDGGGPEAFCRGGIGLGLVLQVLCRVRLCHVPELDALVLDLAPGLGAAGAAARGRALLRVVERRAARDVGARRAAPRRRQLHAQLGLDSVKDAVLAHQLGCCWQARDDETACHLGKGPEDDGAERVGYIGGVGIYDGGSDSVDG